MMRLNFMMASGMVPYRRKLDTDFGPALTGDGADVLRPGYVDWHRAMAAQVPNAEFFVYTAGTGAYGVMMTSQIEKHHDIEFNRPVFGIDYCAQPPFSWYDRKSLRVIAPSVRTALSKRYPAVSSMDDDALCACMIFIDDRKNNTIEKSPRQIVCPPPPSRWERRANKRFDFTHNIPSDVRAHPLVQDLVNELLVKELKEELEPKYDSNNNIKNNVSVSLLPDSPNSVTYVVTKTTLLPPGSPEDDAFWRRLLEEMRQLPTLLQKGKLSDSAISSLQQRLDSSSSSSAGKRQGHTSSSRTARTKKKR